MHVTDESLENPLISSLKLSSMYEYDVHVWDIMLPFVKTQR